MRVYVLRLERARNLQWAFNVIAKADYVVSSTFEAQPCQVRFVAQLRLRTFWPSGVAVATP